MDDRVVAGRRLHQPGQERRLDERQVAGLLAEVGLGGGADAVRVLPEEHGVEVALEDLVLGLVLLEPHGVGHLQQLVATVAFEPGHVVVLDDLHRDRRGALHRTLGGEVRQRRPDQAADVDAVVDVELAVLDGEEGVDHVLRDVARGRSAGCSRPRTRRSRCPARRTRTSADASSAKSGSSTGVSSWALAIRHIRGATATVIAVSSSAPAPITSTIRSTQLSLDTVSSTLPTPRFVPVAAPASRSTVARCRPTTQMPIRPFRFGVQAKSAATRCRVGRAGSQGRGLRATRRSTMPDHFDDQFAPVPALQCAADATTTLRLGALVHDNDYKHPVVLAKELATMDVLSDGRRADRPRRRMDGDRLRAVGHPVRPARRPHRAA